MFATHLWVRAAAVMSGGAEEPSPVKAFLSPLNLVEYRNLLKEQGYDDPSGFMFNTAGDRLGVISGFAHHPRRLISD